MDTGETCLRCAGPAVAFARRGAASMALCEQHDQQFSVGMVSQGWVITRVHSPTGPIPISVPTRVRSLDTPIGICEEILDAEGRLHDSGSVPAYRRFGESRTVMEFRHYRHGVCADPGVDHPAWCIYGIGVGGIFLAHAMRMSNGVPSDVHHRDRGTIYASVRMDAYGHATRIESWNNGVFVTVVDPATLRSN